MTPLVRRVLLLAAIAAAAVAVALGVLNNRPSDLPAAAAAPTAAPSVQPAPGATQPPDRLAELQQRIAANPKDSAALAEYGDILFQRKRYGQAADAYFRALDLEPQSADLHMGFGIALFYQGMQSMAQRELKKAVDLNPNNAEAQFNYALAISHGPTADPEAARQAWEAVVRLDPNGDLGKQAQEMLRTPTQPPTGQDAPTNP